MNHRHYFEGFVVVLSRLLTQLKLLKLSIGQNCPETAKTFFPIQGSWILAVFLLADSQLADFLTFIFLQFLQAFREKKNFENRTKFDRVRGNNAFLFAHPILD